MKSAPDAVGINTALIDHARFGPRLTKVVTAYAICSTIYKSGEQWRQKLKTKQQYQVTVNGTDATYDDLHEWILAQLPENKRRALIARTGDSDSRSGPTEASSDLNDIPLPTLVRLNYDSSATQKITIASHPIIIELDQQQPPSLFGEVGNLGAGFKKSFLSLKFKAQSPEGRDAIIQLIEEVARKQQEKKHVATIRVATRWGSWEIAKSLRPRKWNSLILEDGIGERVRDDLSKFLHAEGEYDRRSIPWHRGYLFHGPAGTGKSSLVIALATHFDMDLWSLPLGDLKTDADLVGLISNVRGGILLLEDVDIFGASKERTAEEGHVSLSALLNSLDGATTPHGLITIMTTNHLSVIDEALYRPGRIDMVVELKEARWLQVINMLENWYQTDAGYAKFVNQGGVFNPAAVQEVMRNNDSIYSAMTQVRRIGKDVET